MPNLRNLSALTKDLINWLVPIAVLGLSVLALNLPLLLGLVLGVVVFAGLYFILNPQGGGQALRAATHDEVLNMLDTTRGKVQQIRRLSQSVTNPAVKGKLTTICELAER